MDNVMSMTKYDVFILGLDLDYWGGGDAGYSKSRFIELKR